MAKYQALIKMQGQPIKPELSPVFEADSPEAALQYANARVLDAAMQHESPMPLLAVLSGQLTVEVFPAITDQN